MRNLEKDEEKKRSIENVVKDMINKSVEVVGVPADKWMQVRSDYISNRKRGNTQSNASEAKKPAEQQNDVVQTAKDLFGEEMVHLMDEET